MKKVEDILFQEAKVQGSVDALVQEVKKFSKYLLLWCKKKQRLYIYNFSRKKFNKIKKT
jgi:hypothetical protein